MEGRDDMLGEELHLAHFLLPRHRPWSKNQANHSSSPLVRQNIRQVLRAAAAPIRLRPSPCAGGTAQTCWRARSFAKPISASDRERSPIANTSFEADALDEPVSAGRGDRERRVAIDQHRRR